MSEVKHVAYYGMTNQGKTWMMKQKVTVLLRKKQKVMVYSAVGDNDWGRGVQFFYDRDALEKALADPKNFGSHVFLDEAGYLFNGVTAKNYPALFFLFSMGRHNGYSCNIATQRPTSIPPMVRENCGECYTFKLGGKKACELVYEDYGSQDYNGVKTSLLISKLEKLNYFHFIGGDFIERGTL